MSASCLRVFGFVAASAWLAVGCSGSKKIQVGATCILNTDCNQPLLCTMSKCHEGCRATVDCPAGQICTKVENVGVCQLPDEASCVANVPCGSVLICAADLRCRAGCSTPANCMGGQVCVQNVCAENEELNNGQLPQISDAGTHDTSSPDVLVTSPADVLQAASGPEAGATYDASPPEGKGDTASTDLRAASPHEAPLAEAGPSPESGTTHDASPPEGAVDSFRDLPVAEIGPEASTDAAGDVDSAVDEGMAPVACTGKPLTISYDGTSTPDSTNYGALFSTAVSSGASWSASGGELVLHTSPGETIWFGNDADVDPVPWARAPFDQGNSVSIRCRLGADSQGFDVNMYSAHYEGIAAIVFMPGYVMLQGGASDYIRQDVDTSAYHTYFMSTGNGRVSYSVDGVEVLNQSLSSPTPQTGGVIIGDGYGTTKGPFGWETGTFYISEAVISTFTSCIDQGTDAARDSRGGS